MGVRHWAALLVALVGCADAESTAEMDRRAPSSLHGALACLDEAGRGTWHVDAATWPAGHLAALETVPARVNAWVGRDVVAFDRDVSAGSCILRGVDAIPDRPDRRIAEYQPETGDVLVMPESVPPCEGEPATYCVSAIVAHEVLHGFGFDHVERGIMQSGTNWLPLDFSDDDRAECVRVGLCVE